MHRPYNIMTQHGFNDSGHQERVLKIRVNMDGNSIYEPLFSPVVQ